MTGSIELVSYLLQVGKQRPRKQKDLPEVTDKARLGLEARLRVGPGLKAWGGRVKQVLGMGDLGSCLLPQLLFSINKFLLRFCLNKSL